jgi:hypothetical protein
LSSSSAVASGRPVGLRSFSAAPMSPRSACSSSGLGTKSKAPAFIAATAVSMLPWAVIIATGVCGLRSAMARTRSTPSPSGRRISVRQKSNSRCASRM